MQTRRPYHHGDLRAALLASAERTLRANGPGALSLRELAREIGVSAAAPSRHFAGKQALLDALAVAGHERLAAALTEAREEAGESFADRLAAIARAYVAFATANAALHDLMFKFKYDPATSDELTAAKQRMERLASELIESGQCSHEVREGPPDLVGVPLTAALQGFTTLVLSGAMPAERITPCLDETIAFLLRGYAP